MNIGVLDIQGSVEEHFQALKNCGVFPVLVKTTDDLKKISGLIIPGGESTTISKLLDRFGLKNEIIKKVQKGMPAWGTCAGAILLAKKITENSKVTNLNLMDIEISRNAYGRQLDSFETEIVFDFGNKKEKIPAVFIRAPRIIKFSKNTKILSRYNNDIVAAKEGGLLVTTFHPEMTSNLRVHEYFLDMCR